MELVHTEVDGVPTVWTEAGGPLQAQLVFRVGRADETLARGGITHLLEHLVLHDSQPRRHISAFSATGDS